MSVHSMVPIVCCLAVGVLLFTAQARGGAGPSAVVRLDKPEGDISPYIYGQFIEHLGRCIYGGIWAEMLEDRKFLALVTSKESPWQRLGGEVGWSLTMDVDKPYVGAWSVKAAVSKRAPKAEACGIVQGGLGLLKGKEYVGYVILAGEGTVEATLAWGKGPEQSQAVALAPKGGGFRKYPIRFTSGGRTDEGRLGIGVRGEGVVWIGTASLMPADNVRGMRADTLAVLKELDSPIYRWPGGNFVSGYDWRCGIGPRDTRAPMKNPAWKGIEHNDFGVDEFIAFCRELKTDPLVVVNTGLGSPELAAAMVEYCNGAPDTPWGKRRAANGHKKPYDVRWWGAGNEMYGGWQLGHTSLDRYTVRHNEFVRAMKAADPTIKVVAVGATGDWSRGMLSDCAGAMDALSEHFYCQAKKDLQEHVAQIPSAVRAKAEAHRRYHNTIPALKKLKHPIPIALDEWNYWYGTHLFGDLGTRYFLRDALGIARGVHEMVRNHDVFLMANYAQTVNVIGAVKTTKTAAAFDTTGVALTLYRRHFGTVALAVQGDTGALDAAAALTKDKRSLTLAVVNPTRKPAVLRLDVRGPKLAAKATRYLVTGDDQMAYNEPGKPLKVKIQEAQEDFDAAAVKVPAISIVLYVVKIEGE